jgi:hypothetical protein
MVSLHTFGDPAHAHHFTGDTSPSLARDRSALNKHINGITISSVQYTARNQSGDTLGCIDLSALIRATVFVCPTRQHHAALITFL